jgi:hypothetical protein
MRKVILWLLASMLVVCGTSRGLLWRGKELQRAAREIVRRFPRSTAPRPASAR